MEFTLREDIWVVSDLSDSLKELIDFLLSDDTLGIVEELVMGDSMTVLDRFELVWINEGNTAEIIRITDLETGDRYAWKVGRFIRDDDCRLYVADGDILRGLSDCDFVVDVYAYRHDFVLMDYVDGYLLSEMDKEYRHDVVEIIGSYFDEVFRNGYIPYDVHTDNVMVEDSGRLVLIDVGEYFEIGNAIVDYDYAKMCGLENIKYG